MSDHFVFPPSQHENLPLEPEDSEIHEDAAGKQDAAELTCEWDKTMRKDDKEEALKIVHDEFKGKQFLDDKGDRLHIQSSEYEPDMGHSPYGTTILSSLHSETASAYDDLLSREAIGTEDSFDLPAESSQLSNPLIEEDNCVSDLPCSAWWRKRADSLYAQAKDANAFWSIFIAASVMGIVIMGQHWQ
ncbi:hypothetical protein SAY86_011163 [Trapa natans]|uniref:Uncharacterized protein n=1 Tax=Trapa natans TaxID=22666 RepID=A0AAN7LTD5_TRANT|nr:hypothetical protein SAY86_011163 [Trapa natans]